MFSGKSHHEGLPRDQTDDATLAEPEETKHAVAFRGTNSFCSSAVMTHTAFVFVETVWKCRNTKNRKAAKYK